MHKDLFYSITLQRVHYRGSLMAHLLIKMIANRSVGQRDSETQLRRPRQCYSRIQEVSKMRTKLLALVAFAFSLLLAAAPTFAHHTWRGYDMKHITAMTGTVTGFDFGNPHVWMDLDVKNDRGEIEKWSAGGPSPSRMANAGWTKDTLHPGDQITIVGNRISDGTYKLRLSKVVWADGHELMCYGKAYGP